MTLEDHPAALPLRFAYDQMKKRATLGGPLFHAFGMVDHLAPASCHAPESLRWPWWGR